MLEFDVWTIVFSVINILVLFFFLKKFLFGRVNAMLEKRAAAVQSDMDQAKQSVKEADQLKSDYEATLRDAKQEAKQIVTTAEQHAKEQGNEITAQAQAQAESIMQEAQKEIERQRQDTERNRQPGSGCCIQAGGKAGGRRHKPGTGQCVPF